MADNDVDLIDDAGTLREIIGDVPAIAADKVLNRLDEHSRRFIELSPFLCLATVDNRGRCDVSPRGDPPGFVKIHDDKTLLIPDRPGNRRVDSMQNLLVNDSIGMIVFVPGISETLRLGGRAEITSNKSLLQSMAIRGQAPKLALRVHIEFVFFHCAKALIRSGLWDSSAQIARSEFPSYGQIIRDQRRPDKSADEVEELVQDDYKNSLY
ncbi:MAG: pyridoxamine 5'-phosphate oxidase family protein [Woeseia sp.]